MDDIRAEAFVLSGWIAGVIMHRAERGDLVVSDARPVVPKDSDDCAALVVKTRTGREFWIDIRPWRAEE